ncbi:endonuclease/exonuclease/phosphatase family protein [Maribellus sp. CM-23]|uniref:endonuclease/exonuclease/phosphatase family protein n=1 Tax=Maribellus sp. CM-23 TaxID=2781026 RepID=UPI001F32564A|nr:endonuclease/exonuclease/phosphatase family protein [Maribellus sp. CM-23]
MNKILLRLRMILILLCASLVSFAQSVIINEIRIDQPSTDNDEYFELAGNAGQDLSGLTYLVIGDGTGGSGVIEAVVDLTGQQIATDGFFVVGESTMTIATPDFLASLNFENSDNVTHLLVSGFTGALGDDLDVEDDGELDVTPWTEIVDGVALLQSTISGDKVYSTIQVGPDGTFVPGHVLRDCSQVWQIGPFELGDGDTPGASNCGSPVEVKVVINEFSASTTGTDVEYVEIKSNPNTDLSAYSVLEIEGDGSSAGTIDEVLVLGTTDANGYYLANLPANTFENGSLTLLLVKNFTGALGDDLDTDNDGVLDATPWEELTDDVAVNDGGAGDLNYSTSVLTVSYDGLAFAPGGASRIPDGLDTDSPADWMRNDFDLYGIPGFAGSPVNGEAISTPGAENEKYVFVEVISLIINEVDADTPGTDTEEFIELYDGGLGNKALDGYIVVLYNGSNDLSYAAYDLAGYFTNADGYFVIGNADVANVDLVVASNAIQNGADAVALYKDTITNFPNGTPVTLTNLEDALVYDTDDSDDAGLLVLLEAGEQQVNENMTGDKDNLSMQRIPNGSGGARMTTSYSMFKPTPGTENGVIVNPPAPDVISIADARVAAEGTTVTISGTLTVADQFAGSAYMQDSTAGIAVFDALVHGAGVFQIGDSITITGTRSVYNGQLQVSPVSEVVSHGAALSPVQPKALTMAELSAHPAELVKLTDVTFPAPGALIFGNSNIVVADASGSGEVRIDADAADLVGLAQPESCEEVIGVVGRYYDLFQLMPRIKSDLPCAEKYKQTGDDLAISKEQTLDVVTWNIEWFGDEGNSPAKGDANTVQKDSVKAVLNALDADIYAVEEISDDALFAQMVSEMNGYDYVLSNYTSNPNDAGVKQKVGFIYKTSTVSVVKTMPLLASIHPYYNGGDGSALVGYPDPDVTRFYASGRLPFMMVADVTINGVTVRYHVIDIHARANNSSDPLLRYQMRKYDVEVLKDTLDQYYSDANLILLGDYNDDVDVTVADITSTTASSYESYVADADNYKALTGVLSENGFRSYVFETDMIDHISVSNELFDEHIDGSARVHYEFYDSDYTNTASDHFPVSVRLQVESLAARWIVTTEIDCFEGDNGTATVEVTGGIPPYTYAWSNGQTLATASNLSAGIYTVTVSDALNNSVSAEVELFDPVPVEFALTEDQVVYPAYSDSACATLAVAGVTGGAGDYSYLWSTGETSESIMVCPDMPTVYYLTVTDGNECSVTDSVLVSPVDVYCTTGKGMDKIQLCYKGKTMCVAYPAVDELIKKGAVLGACVAEKVMAAALDGFMVYPNPFVSDVAVTFSSDEKAGATVEVYAEGGTAVYSEIISIHKGYNKAELNLSFLTVGTYVVVVKGSSLTPVSGTIIKQ